MKSMALAQYVRENPGAKKLTPRELHQILSRAQVVDRIHQFFVLCARGEQALTEYKRKHGLCGGSPACITYVGAKVYSCSACRKQRRAPSHKNRRSAYGEIRAKMRAEEKSE